MVCLMDDGKWRSIGIPIASLPIRVDVLAGPLGARVQSWDEDGLGPAHGFGFVLKSGRMFVLEELDLMIQLGQAHVPLLYVDEIDYLTLGAKFLIDEVAIAIGIPVSDFAISEPIYSGDLAPPSPPAGMRG